MSAPRSLARARALLLGLFATGAHAATFTVSNTQDAGTGSLRQAILDANAQQVTGGTACAPHTIQFAIPGSGPFTIRPLSALPRIDIGITIDGYSQAGSSRNTLLTGSNAVILIELDGSLAGAADALVIGALVPGGGFCGGSGSVIQGLVINRFGGAAISMGEQTCPAMASCTVGGVRIQGNYIGTDTSGSVALGNGGASGRPALRFGRYASTNIVGDQILVDGGPQLPLPQTRNVISGNAGDGIYMGSDLVAGPSINHRIRNNYIGVSASGTVALPNAGRGVVVDVNSVSVAINDNLISGNGGDGVRIVDTGLGFTNLEGNGIGIGIGGVPLGNGGHGVRVSGTSRGIAVARTYPFVFTSTAASISNNAGTGILVEDGALLDFVAGSVSGNGGLEIDLAPIGVTPNDAGDGDAGPNELLNAPVIDSAEFIAPNGTITGSYNGAPSTSHEIHFYLDTRCDPSGHGGARTQLSAGQIPVFVNVTTNASGDATFSRQVPFLPPGQYLSAHARRFSSGPPPAVLIVSELSPCKQIGPLPPLIFADSFE